MSSSLARSAGSVPEKVATALAAFVLKESGVPAANLKLMRALNWLRSHQDKGGYWAAESMNRKYDAGSMPALFMRDAATAFAVLALLDANGSKGWSSLGVQH